MSNLGKKIKYLRQLKGFSQENLAGYLNKSQNWVSKVESGLISLDNKCKKKIAEFFDLSKDEMENMEINGMDIIEELKQIKEILNKLVGKDK
ncbi:MAG: helix-turn-helix transcriptional regulator [bacterium]|nr:helix-turn-helix transcriptional regulator [bacterium]